MTDKEKILKYLNYKGISKNKFYVKTGFSVGFLDSGSSLGVDKLRIIIDNYHDLNPGWFFNDAVSMLKDEKIKDNKAIVPEREDINGSNLSIYKLKTDYFGVERQQIPLYEVEASAGLALLFSNQTTQIPIDHIEIPNAPKCDGAMYIRGDSMYPILKAGDIACYKIINNLDNVILGEKYILDISNEDDDYLTVKFVKKSDKGVDYFSLVSENKHHADRDIHISTIRAIAMVKVVIRFETLA